MRTVAHFKALCRLIPVVLLSLTIPVGAQNSFTLESALQRAHEANLDLLLSREQIVNAEEAQRQARSTLLPHVTANVVQGRAQNRVQFGEDQVSVFRNDQFDARLRAVLTLFNVDDHASYRVARFNTEISRLTLEQTAEDVRASIARLYFTHLRNLRQADAIKAQIERDRVLFELASRRVEAGAATEIDRARAEVLLASSELRLVQQETAIFESALNFKRGLDLELGGSIELAPVEISADGAIPFSAETFGRLLDRRPEIVSERRTLARNQLTKRAADYQWLPSVELSGSYGMAGETLSGDQERVWAAQIGLSMPLFEGFRIDADRARAASIVRSQEINLHRMEQQIEAEYRLALAQVDTNARSVQIAVRQVALAERELALARNRFSEGVADNSEVVDAQASLAEAEDGLVAAEFQYNLARLALARAMGDVGSLVR